MHDVALAVGNFSRYWININILILLYMGKPNMDKPNMDKPKIVYITCFSLITIVLALINYSPAYGYEISIYSALPVWTWLALLASIFLSIAITVYLLSRNCNRVPFILLGIFIIFFSNMIVLLLPLLRGYYIYGREDTLTQLGHVLDIIFAGHISDINIYPLMHIFICEISQLSSIPPTTIFKFIGVPFYLLFVLFTYIFSRSVLTERESLFSVLASTTLLFSTFGYYNLSLPFGFIVLMIPFYLYLYFRITLKGELLAFRILLILLLIFTPYFHPLMGLNVILIFFSLDLFKKVSDVIKGKKSSWNILNDISFKFSLISFITLITWIQNHDFFWNKTVSEISSYFIGEMAAPSISEGLATTFSEKFDFQLLDIIILYFKTFGHDSIFIIITLVIIITGRFFLADSKRETWLFMLSGYFLLMASISFVGIFASNFSFLGWRYIALLLLITPIFVGILLDDISKYSKINKVYNLIIISILVASSVIGLLSVYGSPYTEQPNVQATSMEFRGAEWILAQKNISIPINFNKESRRFSDALFGTTWKSMQIGINPRGTVTGPLDILPDHFGYPANQTLSEALGLHHPIYLYITKYHYVYYLDIYKIFNKFYEDDFKDILHDWNANIIYCNGDMITLLINSETNFAFNRSHF